MKSKIAICAILILLVHENIFSQMMLSANIDGRQTEKVEVNKEPATINLDRANYNNVCNFDVILEEKNAQSAYKRTIELTDANGSRLYTSDELKDNPGVYRIDFSGICKKMAAQTIIKIMLLENPANDLMALPSKMKQIAEVHIK